MADKQYGVSAEDQRNFEEKQKRRLALRNYYFKHITNPHRHASGEGGWLFDPAIFRFHAMRAKQYDTFRPTPINGFYAFCLLPLPLILFSYWILNDRAKKEQAYRNGEVSYHDRAWKLI